MSSFTTAFLFPGQGSQAVGMGVALAASHQAAKHVFDEVNDALDENLFDIMAHGPDDLIRMTRNAQPGLFATSMAAVRVPWSRLVLFRFSMTNWKKDQRIALINSVWVSSNSANL